MSIKSPHTAQGPYPDLKVKAADCIPLYFTCFPAVPYCWLCPGWFSLREDLHWRGRVYNALHPYPSTTQFLLSWGCRKNNCLRSSSLNHHSSLRPSDISEWDCPTLKVFPAGNEGTTCLQINKSEFTCVLWKYNADLLQSCSLDSHPRLYCHKDQHVELFTSLCWTSWVSWYLISPAHKSPSSEQLSAKKPLPSTSLSVASLLMVYSIHALHSPAQVIRPCWSQYSPLGVAFATSCHLDFVLFLITTFELHNTANFTSTSQTSSPSHISPVSLQVDSGRPCQVLPLARLQKPMTFPFLPWAWQQSFQQRWWSGWSGMICPW